MFLSFKVLIDDPLCRSSCSSLFSGNHSFLVLLVSYDLFSSLLLYSGLMFPCRVLSCGLPLASVNAHRASGVVISCRLLSCGLLLASANAYRALGVVILSLDVVLWSASCIG